MSWAQFFSTNSISLKLLSKIQRGSEDEMGESYAVHQSFDYYTATGPQLRWRNCAYNNIIIQTLIKAIPTIVTVLSQKKKCFSVAECSCRLYEL